MRRAVQAIGTSIQVVPMIGIGLILGTAPMWLVATNGNGGRTGFELDFQTIVTAYGIAAFLGGVLAIGSFKAAVFEAFLAGVPVALAAVTLIDNRAFIFGFDFVVPVAVPAVVSLIGFAIRVLAMPEPAANGQISGVT